MNFKIVCDELNRLRLRFGKYAFSKEQGYSITNLLMEIEGITMAQTNTANGSVLFAYESAASKTEALKLLSGLNLLELEDGVASDEVKRAEIETAFRQKLSKMCLKQAITKTAFSFILPGSFHAGYVGIKSIPYLRSGMRCMRKGRISVEVLDATAIGSSLCTGQHDTSSSIMFLLSLSELLLEYSNARAKNALAGSLAINIDKVWLVRDGEEIQIPTKDLCIGDVIRVRTGSMIPVDGTIVDGDALINEAMMTGEPLSVHKNEGSTVFAGTVIEEGDITLSVRELSNSSRISKIIQMIDTGEENKAAIQGNAEKLADRIVPVSFGLFFATLAFTGNFTRALSVLMVDFSCAIKLTTPLVIITALREATQNQVLVKGGKYLELLSKVDTVVFDKTGTLTKAVPKISKVISVSDAYTEDTILTIAACLEEHFPHSVASAIVAHAVEKDLVHPENHEKVEYIVAHGIASSYQGHRAVIGSKHFVFEDENIPLDEATNTYLTDAIGSDSAVYLAIDNELVGVVCINDPPRDDAKETIEALRKEGIQEIIMITGDGEAVAKHICDELGIDRYFASVLPDGKSSLVQSLKEEGKTILMVGDGINDAPALSMAHVSATLKGSSDIAREVSDIAIHNESLLQLVYARKFSTALMNKISNNYNFIVGFNSMLILLGMGGVISSSTSAWLHNVSTLSLAGLSTRPTLKSEEVIEHETT
ncbi:heavy metal translocating P-type ATPase [Chakrabartyella piscis]|uniref:heavy metal translocating P-type ATPase n=1 Tax=Chakrabartyella piscis TaxID=2918914 RepID=UPI002958BCE1|nr:heavy metal translocating P-type ATPase [Chakrabartyella piscis]